MVMELDFAFAFNEAKFSDRLLRIQITGDGDGKVSFSSNTDLARNPKRRRGQDSTNGYEDEKLPKSVKEIHISSLLLAANSPFFFKLFSNGMLESEQRDVTLNIDASEEAAVMELLNFMYCNSLSVTTGPALLDVLLAADKYEVASCMKYCSGLLLDMPMSVEFALLLLDLPLSVVAADSVKPLLNAARQHLASHYKDISEFPLEEIVALPLVGIEAILESNDLEIVSEDHLYDLVLNWAKTHYSDPHERQEVLGSRLVHYIRFPHMTFGKLEEIATSNDLTPSLASKITLEALVFKGKSLHQQRRLAAEHPPVPRVTERAYKYRPIQIVEFEIPRHQCIVYLDLTRKECAGLYPSGRLYSQAFTLGVPGLYLCAECKMDQSSSIHHFGMFLGIPRGGGSVSLSVGLEFAARSKPTEEFLVRCKGNRKFSEGKIAGTPNLLSMSWESFMAKDCPYFINDILHLRAEISLRP